MSRIISNSRGPLITNLSDLLNGKCLRAPLVSKNIVEGNSKTHVLTHDIARVQMQEKAKTLQLDTLDQ